MDYGDEIQKVDLLMIELKRCASVLKKYPGNKPMRQKVEALKDVIIIRLDAIPDAEFNFAHWEAMR